MFSLLEKGSPRATGAGVAADAGDGGSPPDAAAVVPRARHESSQKPGRESLAEGLAEQSLSVTPEGFMKVSGGGGDGGGYANSSTRVSAAAAAEQGRRPRHSISRKTPPDNWEDLAMPTPEKHRRDIPRPPSHQPLFPSPSRSGGTAEETGDVGDLFSDLSTSESAAGDSERRPAGVNGVEGDSGRGDDQHTAANIDAVMAEVREGDGVGNAAAESEEESGDQIAAVDMDDVVAGLGQRGGGKEQAGGPQARRMTAENFAVDSLFDATPTPPKRASAFSPVEHPESGGSVGEAGVQARKRSEASMVGGRHSAAPKASKRPARRETADPSDLEDLLRNPGGVSPLASPVSDSAPGALGGIFDASSPVGALTSSGVRDAAQQQEHQREGGEDGGELSSTKSEGPGAAEMMTPRFDGRMTVAVNTATAPPAPGRCWVYWTPRRPPGAVWISR
ncbi:unnamed protein product [Scytosiphon promiscuus]